MAQYEHVPCHVVDARYLGDYKVWLEFNDGRKGVVDLADELYGEEFEGLRDRSRFAEFYLDYGLATIAWHEGGALYWLTNTLLEDLSNQQMLAIARSARPLLR